MKSSPVLTFALLLIACMFTGCSSRGGVAEDPDGAVAYIQAEETFATTVRSVTLLIDAGVVKAPEAQSFLASAETARAALDGWNDAILNNRPFDGFTGLQLALDHMARVQVQANATRRNRRRKVPQHGHARMDPAARWARLGRAQGRQQRERGRPTAAVDR